MKGAAGGARVLARAGVRVGTVLVENHIIITSTLHRERIKTWGSSKLFVA